MYAGRLMETGNSQDLMREPAHPYTRGLLNSFPSLRGAKRELVGIPGVPPDLRDTKPGCPFIPRCHYAVDACATVDMSLAQVAGTPAQAKHLTACPIVTPEVFLQEATKEASQEGVAS
jgi:peptide/nickel transport system ATP-binding protein